MRLFIKFALMLCLTACSAAVGTTPADPADAAPVDAPLEVSSADVLPVPDVVINEDASVDVRIMEDAPTTPARLIASLSAQSPLTRLVPRNVTGMHVGTYDLMSLGPKVPMRDLRFRDVGGGPASDIGNVYLFAVPSVSVGQTPFRYSPGRNINPRTYECTIPRDATLRAGATTTVMLVVDLQNATPGTQHVFELTEVTTDLETIPISDVRSEPIVVSEEYASQLTVERGPVPEAIHVGGAASSTIASFGITVDSDNADLAYLSLTQGGSVLARDLIDLELWQGTERISLLEWMQPLNGHLALALAEPAHLSGHTSTAFSIRARVMAPVGQTIRAYIEYPCDIRGRDTIHNSPVAVCIASRMTGGCRMAGEGSFDGEADHAHTLTIIP